MRRAIGLALEKLVLRRGLWLDSAEVGCPLSANRPQFLSWSFLNWSGFPVAPMRESPTTYAST